MQVSLACCQIAHVVLPHGPPDQPRWWYLPATKAPLVTSDETTLQTSNQANLESNNIRYLTYINLYDFLQSFPHNPTNKYPFPRSLHSSFGLASLLSLTSSIKSIDATKKSWLVPLLRVRSHALVFLAKSWIGQNRYLIPFHDSLTLQFQLTSNRRRHSQLNSH